MRRILGACALAVVVLSGCGGDGNTATGQTADPTGETSTSEPVVTPTATSPMSPPAAQPVPGTVITTADSEFGVMLFHDSGQAIYLFDKELSSTPECYDDCAVAWPPVLTDGPPVAAEGVLADLLGTSMRTDGSMQVTYAGHPLYFYAHEGPNEVRCHNVREFGGLWLVVTPTGEAAPA
jgi:predicted lipoprotein with Yx(FWY)xxD motif